MTEVSGSSDEEIKAIPRNNTSRRRIISPPINEEWPGRTDAITGGPSQKDKEPGKPRRSPKYSWRDLALEASQMVARIALKWLDEIDEMRVKSGHLQGGISGDIKWRLHKVKTGINILAQRAEDTGDTEYLRRRNAELEAQVRAVKMEKKLMTEDMTIMESKIKDLRREMRALKDRMGSRSVSLEPERVEKNVEGRTRTRGCEVRPRSRGKPDDKAQLVSLKEIDNSIEEMMAYDEQLSQQMDLIQKIREVGRRRIEEATGSESDLPKERMRDGKRSFGSRVVSNT